MALSPLPSSLCGSLPSPTIYPEICDRGSADRVRRQCARNVRLAVFGAFQKPWLALAFSSRSAYS